MLSNRLKKVFYDVSKRNISEEQVFFFFFFASMELLVKIYKVYKEVIGLEKTSWKS